MPHTTFLEAIELLGSEGLPHARNSRSHDRVSIVVVATSGHLGQLTVEDLLARGVPAGDLVGGVRSGAFAYQNGDLARLIGRPTTSLVDGLRRWSDLPFVRSAWIPWSAADRARAPVAGWPPPKEAIAMSEPAATDVASLLTDGTATGSWNLDPAGSRAEFRVKHFWGAITVRGIFERMTGEATVGPDGTITGRITFDAESLSTKNKQRDKHLRSPDFFHVDQHPQATLTITSARPTGPAELECQGTFEAAGHTRPVSFTAHIDEASAQSVVLTAELEFDRSEFEMTWSPLHIASMTAHGTVKARFARS